MTAGKNDNELYFWGGLITIGIYLIARHEWTGLIAYIPAFFFILTCFFILVIPTRCRFPTRRDGPCRNKAYGIIFGCKRFHFWMKARAKLRIGRPETPPPPAHERRRKTGGAGFETYSRKDEPLPVRLMETPTGRISARLGVLSACLGIITSVGTIATWVEKTAQWVMSLFG
jgi:hypothetical protein